MRFTVKDQKTETEKHIEWSVGITQLGSVALKANGVSVLYVDNGLGQLGRSTSVGLYDMGLTTDDRGRIKLAD